MFDRLFQLKELGYTPDTIFDIGACYGNWTRSCQQIYPEASYYLFEPIHYPQLSYVPNATLFHILLDERERTVQWYERQNTGDSMFKERTHHYQYCSPVEKQSVPLAKVIQPYLPLMSQVFLKLDTQGAELPILKGAGPELLAKTDFILLELPFFGQYNEGVPTFLEHLQYLDQIGFVPFDLLEQHYIQNYLLQVDILFIAKGHPLRDQVQTALLH